MSLTQYHNKRNFCSTNEPRGKVTRSTGKQFVVQYHEARTAHYDFRLEHNGVLLSWAIPKGLSYNPKHKRLAIQVEDHPLQYAQFSGVIPKGNYGAGTVEIFDKGNYYPVTDLAKGIKKGHVKILLNGEKLKGVWSLIRFKDNQWFAIKIDDKFASNKIVEPSKTTLPFQKCAVQLATLADNVPKGKDWLFEIKYDGYRILSFVENQKVKILTRNGQDYTQKLSTIADSLKHIKANSYILDGEVVCFDDKGKSDFGLLQNYLKTNDNKLCYCVFDLLALDGKDLRSLPLRERKEKLEKLFNIIEPNIMYSAHTYHGTKTLTFAKVHNLEGIIAKQTQSQYHGKRTEDWLKIKCYARQEFVIAGYTTSVKNNVLSALILGYYQQGELIYAGKVGTGFTEHVKQELSKVFQSIKRKQSPFTTNIPIERVIWLKPQLVAEIQFAELTKEKLLRQPSFIALRHDKNAKDVVLEQNEKH